ncbi:MAG: hypothetical protein WB502_09655 [Thermoactinomyces sp.]
MPGNLIAPPSRWQMGLVIITLCLSGLMGEYYFGKVTFYLYAEYSLVYRWEEKNVACFGGHYFDDLPRDLTYGWFLSWVGLRRTNCNHKFLSFIQSFPGGLENWFWKPDAQPIKKNRQTIKRTGGWPVLSCKEMYLVNKRFLFMNFDKFLVIFRLRNKKQVIGSSLIRRIC